MGKDLLVDLGTYREDVLLASAAALLHNLGKCADDFVRKELEMLSGQYFFQQIAGLIRLHDAKAGSPLLNKVKGFGGPDDKTLDVFRPKTQDILSRQIINLPPPWNDRSYRVGDLIEYLGVTPWSFLYKKEANTSYGIEQLTGSTSYLTHLMNLCHHGASGSEKQDIYCQQQKNAPDGAGFWVFLATPFGYEKVNCTDQSYVAAKDALENSIEKFFSGDKASFSLKEFARELQPNLQQVLGDTRRPLNDMTVWDIGHSGMAFLKAGIWSIHQQGSISHDMLNNSSKRYWRVLSYRLNGLEFIQKANSLPELKARRQLLNEELDSLQDFLEEKYPLATEIYRDENGSIFIFPDLDWPAELMTLKSKADAERTRRLEQIYGLKPRLDLTSEAYYNHPDAKGGPYIGSQISRVMASTPVAEPCLDAFLKAEEPATQADLCPHCGVRQIGGGAELLGGKRAREMKSCCVCLKLREGRAREWAEKIGGVNSTGINDTNDIDDTIWLNEIADANGRLALVVGRWDLEALHKRMYYPAQGIVYLVRARARFLAGGEPPDGTKVSIKDGEVNLQWDAVKQVFTAITTDMEHDIRFKKAVIKNVTVAGGKKIQINLDDLVEQGGEMYLHLRDDFPDFSVPGVTVKVFGQDFEAVNSRTLKTASQEAKDKIYKECCWQNLGFPFFLQSPEYFELKQEVQSESFARRRRVWQTARQFWQEVMRDFRQHYINNNSRPCRLEIRGHLKIRGHLSERLPSYQAYEILLAGIKLSVVWDGERFITADNLQYLSRPQQLGKDVAQWLREHAGQPLPVTTSIGYGKSDKPVAEFTVAVENGIKILRDGGEYHPLTEILAEPQTFMALVPAQDALVLVNIIKQKYEREMGKVHQRLPLHVGIVFAHRRTPLRVILDAGKRMIKIKTRCGFWQVQSSTKRSGEEAPNYLKKDPHFASWAEVTLKDHLDGRLATWRVPLKMGDGTSDDEWYPYAILEGTNAGDVLLHVGKLQDLVESGNKPGIEFVPATLDFEFLDTGGRRFEIAYDEEGRRRGRLQQHRPYLLQDLEVLENIWNLLSQGLAKNQIYTLHDMIEAKREDWDLYENITNCDPAKQEVFLQFCRDALAWAPWHPGKRPDIAQLAEYAARGLLADAVELYQKILDQAN